MLLAAGRVSLCLEFGDSSAHSAENLCVASIGRSRFEVAAVAQPPPAGADALQATPLTLPSSLPALPALEWRALSVQDLQIKELP